MAMMKYGRTTKTSTPPSKSTSNVTNKEVTESPKERTYGETLYSAAQAEEINKRADKYYNDLKAYNDAQEKYKADVKAYEDAMKFYKSGPGASNVKDGFTIKGGKNVKGQNVSFSSDPDAQYYSAERANEDLNRAMKENKNIVDINDPSINPTSRKIYMEQVGKNLLTPSDLYGPTTGQLYVDKEEINKIKSNIDVWGEDFDNKEWEEANKKGSDYFQKYLDKKGYSGRTFVSKTGGAYTKYKVPTPPTETPKVRKPLESEKVNRIKTSQIHPRDIPRLTAKKTNELRITHDKKKTLPDLKSRDLIEWDAPTPKGSKSALKLDISREGGQGGKWGLRKKFASNDSGRLNPAVRFNEETQTYTRPKGLRYKREEKLAKAFYSPVNERGRGGYYAKGDEGLVEAKGGSYQEYIGSRKQMKQELKDLRSERRDYRKESTASKETKKAAMQDFREDIKTARLAKAYARKGRLAPESEETWKEGDKSRLKYFTPDTNKKMERGAMYNYVKAAESHIGRASDLRMAEQRDMTNSLITKGTKSRQYVASAEKKAAEIPVIKAKAAQFKGWDKKINAETPAINSQLAQYHPWYKKTK